MASKTINFVEVIQIGDTVRSFDFADGEYGREIVGQRASYVEGVVIEIGDSPACSANCPHYHIEVTKDVGGGIERDYRVGTIVYPQINGQWKFNSKTNGVTQIANRA